MTKVSRDAKPKPGLPEKYTDMEVWAAYRKHGTTIAADHALGVGNGYTSRRIKAMGPEFKVKSRSEQAKTKQSPKATIGKPDNIPVVRGRVSVPKPGTRPTPKPGQVLRYILTSAQNNTKLHEEAWMNLMALADYYDAEVMVSRFVYDKVRNGGRQQKDGSKTTEEAEVWYDPRLEPHLVDNRVRLAPGLVWCGEMNILPTAVRPLSGLDSYTARDSGIFPHPKLAMESVASGKFEATKFNYTTGCITLRNYIQRKAGLKAEFHHCYGGLLVEVSSKGWWVRQLNADSDGVIHDLSLRVKGGKVTDGHRIEAVNLGDLHAGQHDKRNAASTWEGKGNLISTLKPRYIVAHDTLDFHSRNHHDIRNPHVRFKRHMDNMEAVAYEVEKAAFLLSDLARASEDAIVLVVDSNHDNAMERWLREGDYKNDPVNAVFFLEAQLAKYRAIENMDDRFHLFEWAARRYYGTNPVKNRIRFLRPDESFIICRDRSGGIELGMHGDKGPNGSRGGLHAFAKMGRKSNTGHAHSAGIHDGAWRAGTSSRMDLGYNVGPSSWSHSHILTYGNGKRAIVTVWNGEWRAR